MAKVTLPNIGSAYGSVGQLNANYDAIEAGFENTLSRDGTGPNAMLADFDMNSNDILNAGKVYTGSLIINGVEVEGGDGTIIAPATVTTYQFTATSGQTTYSVAPLVLTTSSSVIVEVNGVVLPPNSVTIVPPSTVQFTPRAAGEVVSVRVFTRDVGANPIPSPVGQTGKILGSDGTDYVWTEDQLGSGGSGGGVEVSVFTYMTASEIADVKAGTRAINVATKIQNAVNAVMAVGGTLMFPRGEYRIDAPIVFDYSAETGDPVEGATNRIQLQGEGAGSTQIVATHGGALFDYRGGTVNGVHTFFNVYGISLYNSTPRQSGSIGVRMDNVAFWRFEDVAIFGFEFGIYGTDVLSGSYNNGRLWSCTYGFKFEFLNFSRPNAISFKSVYIAGHRKYGGHVIGGSLFSMYGCTLEGNGIDAIGLTDGDVLRNDCWGLKFEDSGVEGVVGATIHGLYAEGNAGVADIWISQLVNNCTHSITGSSFLRFISDKYTLNNIRYNNDSATTTSRLSVQGCGFRSQSPYSPLNTRPYFGSGVGKIQDGGGNTYYDESELDRAVFTPTHHAYFTTAVLPSTNIAEYTGGVAWHSERKQLVVANGTKWAYVHDVPYEVISSNANVTLIPFVNQPFIVHIGTLTANRSISFSSINAAVGAKFKVLRKSTSAYALNFYNPTLICSLREDGDWAEFQYDGSAWVLMASGSTRPGSPALSKVRVHRNTTQDVGTNTDTTVVFNVKSFDTLGEYNTSTGVFTATYPGYYHVSGTVSSNQFLWQAGRQWFTRLLVNGTLIAIGHRDFKDSAVSAVGSSTATALVYLNANDQLTFIARTDRTPDADANLIAANEYANHLSIYRVS